MGLVSTISAEPLIHLKPGNNHISISIVNNWNYNLNNIYVNVEKDELPNWLNIIFKSNALYIPKGKSCIFNIEFLVNESAIPFSDQEQHLTLHFKDSIGNQWNQDLIIQLESHIPLKTCLIGNFPNPFNPSTVIKYSIGNPGIVKLNIYNIQGQNIKTLVSNHLEPGQYDTIWSGIDDQGNHVASGMYIYKLETGKHVISKKLMLLQ